MATDKNQRQHIRTQLQIPIKIMHPKHGKMILKTADISDGGAFFICESSAQFHLDEEFTAQVMSHGEAPPPIVKMRVVRISKDGVGLRFVLE